MTLDTADEGACANSTSDWNNHSKGDAFRAQHAPPCSSTSRLATTEAGAKAARRIVGKSKGYKETIASDASG